MSPSYSKGVHPNKDQLRVIASLIVSRGNQVTQADVRFET